MQCIDVPVTLCGIYVVCVDVVTVLFMLVQPIPNLTGEGSLAISLPSYHKATSVKLNLYTCIGRPSQVLCLVVHVCGSKHFNVCVTCELSQPTCKQLLDTGIAST